MRNFWVWKSLRQSALTVWILNRRAPSSSCWRCPRHYCCTGESMDGRMTCTTQAPHLTIAHNTCTGHWDISCQRPAVNTWLVVEGSCPIAAEQQRNACCWGWPEMLAANLRHMYTKE
eukprot:GHUV01030288.1.p2 GENE.GHUV01030288.1~~GHUV01030288.1.p2  ORF type:complete len:117 (-),score=5.25 GHUV01030288.1:304-654(-)